jgi:hypothetical protein
LGVSGAFVAAKSKHRLDGAIIKVARGVAIYKTHASPFWNARVRDPTARKYIVRSTKETSRLKAREVAQEIAADRFKDHKAVPREFSFKHFATRFIEKGRHLVEEGERNANYIRTARMSLDNQGWGLMTHFGSKDVRQLRTRDYTAFMTELTRRRPDLSASTRNMLSATFRNVLKVARDEGVIDEVPATPRTRQRDNPRAFFRFHPLVPKDRDAYKKLLDMAKTMAAEGLVVRGTIVTDELYDLILFVTHSFVRPTVTELYAIRRNDVEIATNPKRLLVTIRSGKTGYRTANTLGGAVGAFERTCERYPEFKDEDYLFLPRYPNRATASRIIARQFNEALDLAGIKHDPFTGTDHTLYSLRHTAICMRLILSEGRVNIFNLAKNAGTSVEQIERFYARNLPLSGEMARNLQSFGSE